LAVFARADRLAAGRAQTEPKINTQAQYNSSNPQNSN
jgi:hypothetical protein